MIVRINTAKPTKKISFQPCCTLTKQLHISRSHGSHHYREGKKTKKAALKEIKRGQSALFQ